MAFEKGNKHAQEWTLENAEPRFKDALKFAEESDECLCLQDAIFETGIPYSTFYYLADNQPVLEAIKKDIQQAIIKRINRNALWDNFEASPAIWRMKQLGEKDQQYIDQNVTGSTKSEIVVSSKETAEEIKKLKDRFKKRE